MFSRVAVAFVISTSPLLAQSDPLELARGLREIGQPDLSLEYLADLEKKKTAADVKTVLPLERAKSRLAIAQMETEEAGREAGVAQAKAEFELFIKNNPKHARVAEAQLALAQVTAVQAIGQLHRAKKTIGSNAAETAKRRKAAVIATRPLFKSAAKLFGDASKNITAQLGDTSVTESRKKELQKASLQAELDRGLNQFRLVETYENPEGKDVQERAAELDRARKIFQDLGRKDPASPVCWQARAWEGMCEYEKTAISDAEKIFKQVKADGVKTAAGIDGVRMVNFFEAYIKYREAGELPEKQKLQLARAQAKTWLDNDRYRPRMTPQRLSMTYYYARLTDILGQGEISWEKQTKAEIDAKKPLKFKSLSSQGYAYMKEACRYYKQLLDFENEYTDRAAEHRTRAVRFIVGDQPRNPKDFTDLEECQMASMLQMIKANDAKSEADALAETAGNDDAAKVKYDAARKKQKEEFDRAIALVERAMSLLDGKTPPREVAETKLNRMFAYYYAGDFAKAAESGEALARTGRGTLAAQGGYFAIESYLRSRDRLTSTTVEKEIDKQKEALREKAIALSMYLDKNFPVGIYTDAARMRIGQLYAMEKSYQLAFDLLGRISATFPDVATARDIQARCAFMLIVSKESTLDDAKKSEVFKKAVDDCNAVPAPVGGPGLKAYFSVRTLLANLHLSNPKNLDIAEKIAVENIKEIAASSLEEADKKLLSYSAEEARLRAIRAQCGKLFEEGKYQEMANRMLPSLGEMNKNGPSAPGASEGEAKRIATNLDIFRRDFILFAMQGRIREGEFDKAAELFELLDKLGGSTDATTNALNSLVAMVRPQVEAFRKAKKDSDADKLSSSIGTLLQKQAEKPKLTARVQASLGRSLRDMGQYDKAVEVLKKVPMPPAEKLFATSTTLEETDKEAVVAYQIAQIELARAFRAAKKYAEADSVLKAALGDDTAKPEDPKSKGWAKSLEFKKEAIYLLEEKAANTPADQKDNRARAWGKAKVAWERLGGNYRALLQLPIIDPNDPDFQSEDGKPPVKRGIALNDRERLIPIYLEILCEYRRCLLRGNSQILAGDPGKLADFMSKSAQSIITIETDNAKSLTSEVKAKYTDLLQEFPAMKEEYKKRGGKAFLDGAN